MTDRTLSVYKFIHPDVPKRNQHYIVVNTSNLKSFLTFPLHPLAHPQLLQLPELFQILILSVDNLVLSIFPVVGEAEEGTFSSDERGYFSLNIHK